MQKFFKLTAVSAFALTITLGASSIAFGETSGQYIDDATITTKVKAALLTDKQLKPTQVSVETNQGAVKLTGNVTNKDQEAEAVKVANQVNGVKSVNDQLMVQSQEY
jgi:hyperosmotically inducible protein